MFNRAQHLCTRCLHVGPSRTLTRGSLSMELVLWGCLALPGLIYSLWRMHSRAEVCALCEHSDLLPAASPRALQMSAKW